METKIANSDKSRIANDHLINTRQMIAMVVKISVLPTGTYHSTLAMLMQILGDWENNTNKSRHAEKSYF